MIWLNEPTKSLGVDTSLGGYCIVWGKCIPLTECPLVCLLYLQ
jgi:hypothetical protein